MTGSASIPTRSRSWLILAGVAGLMLTANVVVAFVALYGAVQDVPSVTPLSGITFSLVGALLVMRRPGNRVGRLLIAMGLVWAVGESAYTYLELEAVGGVGDNEFVRWLNAWAFWPMLILAATLAALFPSGRVASAWMRWPLRIGVTLGILGVLTRMMLPVDTDRQTFGEEFGGNSWAVGSLAPLTPVAEVLDYLVVAFLVVAMVDLVSRWRRSSGVERLQMRWLALGLVVFILLLIAAMSVEAAGLGGVANELMWTAAWLLGLGAVPIAVGVAVLRYRLYEIDRLVSRTVSYTLVVAVLATVFFAVVTILSSLLPAQSDLAVAGSTLAVAALFNPLRRRVQTWVDRRFNRSRYDAQRVADTFAERLRDEVDTNRVVTGWVDAVETTVQPDVVAVWLKGPSPHE